jgi:hypothetical protein
MTATAIRRGFGREAAAGAAGAAQDGQVGSPGGVIALGLRDEPRIRSRRARLWRDQGKRNAAHASHPRLWLIPSRHRYPTGLLPASRLTPPRSGPERSDFVRWQLTCPAGRAGLLPLAVPPPTLAVAPREVRSTSTTAVERAAPSGERWQALAQSGAIIWSHPAKSIGRTLGSQRRKRSVGAHQTSSGCNRSISFQSKPHR